MDTKPRRILIIRTDRIGDVVLSTPVVKALRDAYPDSHIAFMVRPYAKDIVEGNPYLNEVIVYDKYGIHKGFFATVLFALRLRKKRFDTAIILHPTNRAHIIPFVAGIPVRIGLNRKLAMLLTEAIDDKKFLGEKHELEYTLDILKNIGVEARDKSLCMPVKKSDEIKVNSILADKGVKSSDLLVALHPGASCPSKRWPLENFASLIDRLRENFNVRIVVVAGSDDAAGVTQLKSRLKNEVIDLTGGTSVGELAALLKRCRMFISNDSGPVHIAVAVNTPTVVIFGRKQPGLNPKRWGPTGKDDIVLHKDVGCEVCLAHDCKSGFKCLGAVTVDEVFGAVQKLAKNTLIPKSSA